MTKVETEEEKVVPRRKKKKDKASRKSLVEVETGVAADAVGNVVAAESVAAVKGSGVDQIMTASRTSNVEIPVVREVEEIRRPTSFIMKEETAAESTTAASTTAASTAASLPSVAASVTSTTIAAEPLITVTQNVNQNAEHNSLPPPAPDQNERIIPIVQVGKAASPSPHNAFPISGQVPGVGHMATNIGSSAAPVSGFGIMAPPVAGFDVFAENERRMQAMQQRMNEFMRFGPFGGSGFSEIGDGFNTGLRQPTGFPSSNLTGDVKTTTHSDSSDITEEKDGVTSRTTTSTQSSASAQEGADGSSSSFNTFSSSSFSTGHSGPTRGGLFPRSDFGFLAPGMGMCPLSLHIPTAGEGPYGPTSGPTSGPIIQSPASTLSDRNSVSPSGPFVREIIE